VKNEPLRAVSIIIPAYNEERYIEKTLLALRGSDYPTDFLEIIVVDNASADNTVHIARKYSDKVLCLEEGNVGAVRNLGAQHAAADILVFIDADCTVDSGWVARGVKFLISQENCAFGGACKASPQANWIERLWLLDSIANPRIPTALLGSCIFITKVLFEKIGGFNEEMTSGEDSDLSRRIKMQPDCCVKIMSDLSVTHLGNPKKISIFLKRQIWHSENYLRFPKESIKDKTFWSVLVFALSIFSLLLFASFSIKLSSISLIIILIITSAHSIKRLKDASYTPKNFLELIQIFILDFLYLSGRVIGLIKSSKNLL
jgi:glycosyltransferase involved in cell wall biosynthesis